jgi:hypothetical protein
MGDFVVSSNGFMMTNEARIDFAQLYSGFRSPIMALDCGDRCGPYNERGVPFCCDLRHAIPSAYQAEWEYLQANTDLWRIWQGKDASETASLREQAPEGQTLIACKGYEHCVRDFRSLTCRSFPFFPYISRQGAFIGLSYYWEYEARCWVISNLQAVTSCYLSEFVATYETLFAAMPQEKETFRHYSGLMRRIFGRRRRAIPLLHRNGGLYKITPRNGRLRRVPAENLPRFGPYKIAAELPFPDAT